MSKKDFAGALRKTATAQKSIINDRFTKADSVLLGMKAESNVPPAPVPVTVPSPASPPVVPPSEAALPDILKGEATVVRDTFSMPPSDHALIERLRVSAAREGRNTNKSEVVRAGLHAMASLSPTRLLELLDGLERMKPGRK